MTDSESILRALGVTSRAPFDWGDEPHAKLEPISSAAPTTRSGLDLLKQFVQDKSSDDYQVKRVLRSLLVKGDVPLTTEDAIDKRSTRKRYFDLLEEDGDIASRDVSIRGLSDRACAELTVESRSSLFGSILRIFDIHMDPDGNRVETEFADAGADSGAEKAASPEKVIQSEATTATSSDIAKSPIDSGTNTNLAEESIKSNSDNQTESGSVTTKTKINIDEKDKADKTTLPVISPEIMAAAKTNQMIAQAPILSTSEIVRSCHLTASPGDVPACMDSKEFTMAALHFLSSYVPFISEKDDESKRDKNQSLQSWMLVKDTFPVLPLLIALNPEESLEKRVYGRVKPLVELGRTERKEYPDCMDSDREFRRKVLNLERAFTSSLPFSSKSTNQFKPSTEDLPLAFQRYVPRRKLCPRIETEGVKEELTLMISGHVQQENKTASS